MKSLYQMFSKLTLAALCVVSCSMFSCEGEEGPIGPQGEQGEQGEQGTPGEQGSKGEDAFPKAGYFDGTISGRRQDGEEFTETFKYEYCVRLPEVLDEDEITFGRMGKSFSFLSEVEVPFITVGLYFQEEEDGSQTLVPAYFDFAYHREINTSSLFAFGLDSWYFNDENSQLEITNYVHDNATGIVSFDYTYTDDGGNNSTGNPVTIKGKFNSGNAVYKNILNREEEPV